MLTIIGTNFLIVLTACTALWLLSVLIKDASIIDIFWGPFCATSVVATYFIQDVTDPRAMVITGLICIWAARLAIYLGIRNIGNGEDFRYVELRELQGSDTKFAIWSLPRVYWMQGVVAWLVSLPAQVGQIGGSTELGILAFVGIGVFVIGLLFEAIGDAQLRAFKKDPANAGKLMDRGLWAWTRHPNYFGDFCVWAGITLIALESPWGWTTLLSPMIMLLFLYRVTGKKRLERFMRAKYPDFADYEARTSGFFPMPPKKRAS